MMHEHVAPIEGREDVRFAVRVADDLHRWDRLECGVLQLGPIEPDERPQVGESERPSEPMHVLLGQLELAGQQVDEVRGHAPIDLEADGRAEASAPQLGFEGAKQVIGRVVIELEVGGSGDPERVPGQDLHAREEQVEVGGDHLLERHERRCVVGGQESLEEGRHLDPREL